MTNKTYSFLGLAQKAGKLVSGEFSCEGAVRSGKAYLVIIAENASQNTKKRFEDACKYRNLDFRIFGSKEELGRCIGKNIRAVVAVTDRGFAKNLISLIDNYRKDFGGEQYGKNQSI